MKLNIGNFTISIEFNNVKAKVVERMLSIPTLAERNSLPEWKKAQCRITRKIEGIRLHRALTGAGLKDSKEYIEKIMAEEGIEP